MADNNRLAEVVQIPSSDQPDAEFGRQRHELAVARLGLKSARIQATGAVLAGLLIAGGAIAAALIAREGATRPVEEPENQVPASEEVPEGALAPVADAGASAESGADLTRQDALLNLVSRKLPAGSRDTCERTPFAPHGAAGVRCSTRHGAALVVYRFREGGRRNAFYWQRVRRYIPWWRRGYCAGRPPCSNTYVHMPTDVVVGRYLVKKSQGIARVEWAPVGTRMYGILVKRGVTPRRHVNAWLAGPLSGAF